MADNPDCSDFSTVVGKYVECLSRIKTLREEMKDLRAKLSDYEKIIVNYMETKALDICRITKDGESGQLCVSKGKSTKGVKRDTAVAEIAQFFDENRVEFDSGNHSTKADELWGRVQNTRETHQKKGLKLK